MTPQPWQQLSSETLVHYKVFHVRKARRRSPRTGAEIGIFLLDTADWVNVLPITDDGHVVMVRQWRHGCERVTLEIPGGLIDAHETDPAAAAARELREETGYDAAAIERIEVVTVPLAELDQRVAAGEIEHAIVLATLAFWRAHQARRGSAG
jgi:8-oxo-dGTP pyrophosphatase MutT (NUDIX family)